ncbi:MAG: hypothetical protein R3288_11770 [Woeseiaceae bacterium]|nr:hypothetical protein [Woeseiaceae bacterium]
MRAFLAILLGVTAAPVFADELDGDYLYRVTTLRAAPGQFAALLDWFASMRASDDCVASLGGPPMLMRHTQGDHWDLLVITPLGSWDRHYSPSALRARERAANRCAAFGKDRDLLAYEEDLFAFGPDPGLLGELHEANDFYHIEMFAAAPGKSDELFEQRRMENAYLAATGQTPNTIFRRAAGSDIDVFTIGYHASFEAFATPSAATDEEREAAARSAGFRDRADISFYLRKLISSHHDTLAISVR